MRKGRATRPLLLFPVGDWTRHKVFAHMLLRNTGLLPAK